jgi:small-conductance mechanosensitive channel
MRILGIDLMRVVVPLAVAGGVFVVSLVVRGFVRARLEVLARRTASDWDDAVLRILRGPVVLWLAIASLAIGAEFASLSGRVATLVQRVLVVLVVVSITWVAARVAGELVGRAMSHDGARLPAASLVENVVRGVIFVLGALVVLQTLGISIVPIITALGVGGLAVALALQDTLSNFFAGLHILATRRIRPGDFIRLDSGEEGHVEDVTWRHTSIRQGSNVLTIVPNAKLAAAVTTNYSLPDPATIVQVPCGVAYGSDLAAVERVTLDVARDVMRQAEGGVPAFEPLVRFTGLGDSAVTFSVVLQVREQPLAGTVRHELIKRLYEQFGREGIEIPFPQRVVHLRNRDEG